MPSPTYKRYTYQCNYHGSYITGDIAAVNDEDAETEVRNALGWQKFAFASTLIITDSSGAGVLVRGRASDLLTPVKTKPKSNFPRYKLTNM